MKTGFLLLLFLAQAHYSRSQLTEQFSDGNFTANPAWTGTNATFIVNAGNELQTSNTIAATSYLTTPHGLSTLGGQEWRVRVKITTAPSTSNFSRVYLTAASADLSTNPDGFFLQFGEAGSTDALRLKKSVSGVETTICSGTLSEIAASFNVSVRVVRDQAGVWSLYTDPAGGVNYVFASSATDAAVLLGSSFGVLSTYTASNATKYYFDDIYVGAEIIDSQPPVLLSATVVSATQVDLLFDEAVSGTAAATASNYALTPSVSISAAAIDGANLSLVHLSLAGSLSNGQSYTLTVASIEDAAGNSAANLSANFTHLVHETPEKGDVIITEFMCDPSPVIGLPEVEFVEIHNVSAKYFNLAGWKIGDGSADGTITSGWIAPGAYQLLCATSSQTHYPTGLAVTSFPSLNNASDDLVLKDASLLIIDQLHYTDEWYNDDLKQAGGYTLERINPNDPCSDRSNWTASNAAAGGTPGVQNSVYSIVPDLQAPSLVQSLAIAPNQLQLVFSEGMDSTLLINALFQSDPSLTVQAVAVNTSFPDTAMITFAQNIMASKLYGFTYGPLSDCWMNTATISGFFALASDPEVHDLVINELLYDPGTGGSDFVELYNRSSKVLDLHNYSIANYDDDTIANFKTISTTRLLFPGEYIVLTADSVFQKQQFPESGEGSFYQMSLPSFNNDSSSVYLLWNNVIIDKIAYTSDWQLSLLDNTDNKTLERIDPSGVSNSPSNWHTAAETIGFGTPGKQNSQYQAGGVNGSFGTLTPVFSPDNDGFEDVLLFYYTMPQPGMIATVNLYDDQGRLIKELMKSELLGLEGNFSWNGCNDAGAKTPIGIYLAVIEGFTPDGKANFSKRIAFTLAGRVD